jgi:hypothetical protein
LHDAQIICLKDRFEQLHKDLLMAQREKYPHQRVFVVNCRAEVNANQYMYVPVATAGKTGSPLRPPHAACLVAVAATRLSRGELESRASRRPLSTCVQRIARKRARTATT